ncbi:MAG: gephyrin-like molybdotransferase Glp [Magnetospiraceae bacterium]
MIPVEEALAHVRQGVAPIGRELVSLSEALGRVLAAPAVSRITQPFADVSAMDGHAVRGADVASPGASLTVIGESAAGRGLAETLQPGQAARIFTGAPLPAGADTIVIQEIVESDGATIWVAESVPEGRFVRKRGMDFTEGDALIHPGKILTARDVGLLAAMNIPWVSVSRRPRVALLATGDELVMPGEQIGPDQILSSNTVALMAAIRVFGGDPFSLGIAKDDAADLAKKIETGRRADLLITIGGASVGDHDLVKTILDAAGFRRLFHKVRMQPGKPTIFGHLGETPVLGLPGNPVSALVMTHIFVRAALEGMLGIAPEPDQPPLTAVLTHDLRAGHSRQEYMRGTLGRAEDGSLVVDTFAIQDSSLLARLSAADCLVIRPVDAPAAKAGDRVSIIPLGLGNNRF